MYEIKRIHREYSKDFEILVRSTEASAAYDLFSHEEERITLGAGTKFKFKTGLALKFPESLVVLLLPRSGKGYEGLNLKNTVGVIETDYFPNEIIVALTNTEPYGTRPLVVEPGDKIAQLLLVPRVDIPGAKVLNVRREGGFGSTGN